MALLRGKLLAGALFAGALFGPPPAADIPQQIPSSGGGTGHGSWSSSTYNSTKKRVEVNKQSAALLAMQHAEDDALLEIIMLFVTEIDT